VQTPDREEGRNTQVDRHALAHAALIVNEKRTIFMTGFPGFIASRLLERRADVDVFAYLLVQPEFVEKAMAEIERIAAATNMPLENFALIEGDITKTDLGISEDDLETLRNEVTDIFHLAAVYDLAVEKDVAFAVNLDGTKNVNAFAASVKELKRYNYISTCYVAGKRTGRILENELEHDAGFRNHYEETKYLAELEVEKLKDQLPVTIFRPSVVVGESQTGETAKYDGIYYLIKYLMMAPGLLRLINVGNPEVRLNLVPVDFVVDGIVALSADERANGKTIALADPQPLATAELFDLISENLSGKRSAIKPPAKLVKAFLDSPISPPLTGLPHSGVPYFFLDQTYDTALADELLSAHNITCPRFSDYADNLLDFVQKHPTL
jgi:thioester reductase-like protein